MNKLVQFSRQRRLLLAAFGLVTIIILSFLSLSSLWQHPQGESLLYGKVADTRDWIEGVENHTPGLLKHAKVIINSLPPQTTYTDEQGQFWFKGLRDISYSLKVEVPYERNKFYQFVARVDGATGRFFDLIQDEEHSLREIDY